MNVFRRLFPPRDTSVPADAQGLHDELKRSLMGLVGWSLLILGVLVFFILALLDVPITSYIADGLLYGVLASVGLMLGWRCGNTIVRFVRLNKARKAAIGSKE